MRKPIIVGSVAAGCAAWVCLSASAEMNLTSMVGSDPAATVKRFRELTDARIAEIRATPNVTVPAGRDVYYLSNASDDAKDVRTPATAWRTVQRLNRATDIRPGSFVLFERGGTWRTSLDLPDQPADKSGREVVSRHYTVARRVAHSLQARQVSRVAAVMSSG